MKRRRKQDGRSDLEAVRALFEGWRAQRVGGGALPKVLWEQAVGLLERYPISVVSRELRLNSKRLTNHRDQFRRAPIDASAHHASSTPTFLCLTAGEIACARRQANPPGEANGLGSDSPRANGPASVIGVAATPCPEPSDGACWITIERPDGCRLTLRLPVDGAVVESLCHRFLAPSR